MFFIVSVGVCMRKPVPSMGVDGHVHALRQERKKGECGRVEFGGKISVRSPKTFLEGGGVSSAGRMLSSVRGEVSQSKAPVPVGIQFPLWRLLEWGFSIQRKRKGGHLQPVEKLDSLLNMALS